MKIQIEKVNPNVCSYCRKLMKKEDCPKTLEVYRGGMLCLTVDVEKASRLQLVEDDHYFGYRTYRPTDFKWGLNTG